MDANDPEVQVAQPAARERPEARPQYEAPAIVWEQEFVALAQASEVNCDPPIDPRCF